MTKFPPEYLSNMTKLTELNLMGSKLKIFPAIINLPRLSFIYIDGEHVSVIRDLSLLPSLIEVYWYSCPLYCGPDLCWFVMEDHNIIPYYYHPLTCWSAMLWGFVLSIIFLDAWHMKCSCKILIYFKWAHKIALDMLPLMPHPAYLTKWNIKYI